MVLHNNVDGADTRFSTMAGPLMKNPLGKWLGVIRRGTYQSEYQDIRWSYKPVSDLWLYVEPDSNSSDDRPSYEVGKYQDNPDYQEQEEEVSVTFSNIRRIIWGDQIELRQIKS